MQLKVIGKNLLTLVGSVILSACGVMKSGESVSYHVWNHDTKQVLYSVKLEANGEILDGADGSRRTPRSSTWNGWDGAGGNTIPQDVGHRIPEIARLSWRLPIMLGQDSGRLVGPFEVNIRNQIPEKILNKIKSSKDKKLAIGISAGVQPIKLRWILQELKFIDGSPVGGWRDLERGGDW